MIQFNKLLAVIKRFPKITRCQRFEGAMNTEYVTKIEIDYVHYTKSKIFIAPLKNGKDAKEYSLKEFSKIWKII